MLFKKHPELKQQLPTCKKYTSYDAQGQLIEAWVLDENGQWKDVTKIELARLEYERVKQAVDKLLKSARQNAQMACPDDFDSESDDF